MKVLNCTGCNERILTEDIAYSFTSDTGEHYCNADCYEEVMGTLADDRWMDSMREEA